MADECLNLCGSLGSASPYLWNGQGLEVSLVNGIATSTGSQLGCRKAFTYEMEAIVGKVASVDSSLTVLAESIQPISMRSPHGTRP
jgi:hypothetical protein